MKIMNKFQKKLANRKKDNKGFSLVELIIVIAIMAILVGIVGTQVIPYIDKSRNAKDIQKLSGLCTDAMTAYSSNAATLDSGETYTITITTGTGDKVTAKDSAGVANATLKNAFTELNDAQNIAALGLESKSGKKVTQVDITCKNGSPMITVHTTVPSGATNFEDITSK